MAIKGEIYARYNTMTADIIQLRLDFFKKLLTSVDDRIINAQLNYDGTTALHMAVTKELEI